MNGDRLHRGGGIVTAAIIAAALVLGGFLIGRGFSQFRSADRYVTVKGLAEMEVKADLAVWPIRFTATGDDLANVQSKVEDDRALVMSFLKRYGLKAEDMRSGRIQVTDLLAQSYRPQGEVRSRFIVNASVDVRTGDVDLVGKISQKTGDLVRKGVVLTEFQGPSYIFTKLNEIKPGMIANATANARAAAEKFARDSKSRLGKIRRARQGVFSILPRDGYAGGPESQQMGKKVRVVSTIEYSLKN
jgi:hypothetical protein